MAVTLLQCALVGLLLTAASAASDNANVATSKSNFPELFNLPVLTNADWQKQLSSVFQMPESCDPNDSHCTVSKTGNTNSKSSSSSVFGGNDEDYHCQVSADGRSKSCSYSSSSSSPSSATSSGFGGFWNHAFFPEVPQRSRKLLQFSCAPNDPHCTTSSNGNTQSSTSIIGSGSDENCQVSADGTSISCSSSSSSGGGSVNANAQSGFWSSVGTAATTWWVWVLFILAAAVALFTLARRRNVYVMLRGGANQDPSSMGLPRFNKGRDNKEAQLF